MNQAITYLPPTEEGDEANGLACMIQNKAMITRDDLLGAFGAVNAVSNRKFSALTVLITTLQLSLQSEVEEFKDLKWEVKTLSSRQPQAPAPAPGPLVPNPGSIGMKIQSYANAAKNSTIARVPTKAKRPAPIFKPAYSKENQELLVDVTIYHPAVSELTILNVINKAIAPSKILQVTRKLRGNLRILTPPNMAASDMLEESDRINDVVMTVKKMWFLVVSIKLISLYLPIDIFNSDYVELQTIRLKFRLRAFCLRTFWPINIIFLSSCVVESFQKPHRFLYQTYLIIC